MLVAAAWASDPVLFQTLSALHSAAGAATEPAQNLVSGAEFSCQQCQSALSRCSAAMRSRHLLVEWSTAGALTFNSFSRAPFYQQVPLQCLHKLVEFLLHLVARLHGTEKLWRWLVASTWLHQHQAKTATADACATPLPTPRPWMASQTHCQCQSNSPCEVKKSTRCTGQFRHEWLWWLYRCGSTRLTHCHFLFWPSQCTASGSCIPVS